MYQNAPWILTRTERTDEASFNLIKGLAESVGARTREIDVARHDALLSFASHLPYMLSTAMVATTDAYAINNNAADVWQVMAGGYRDTSRVAASDVTMWLDILLTNPDAILSAVRDFQFQLDQFAAMLERRDEAGLKALMTQAAKMRERTFLKERLEITPISNLQSPNEPNNNPTEKLSGTLKVPGDRSITVRAVLLGGIAEGESVVRDYLVSDDTTACISLHAGVGGGDCVYAY